MQSVQKVQFSFLKMKRFDVLLAVNIVVFGVP